MSGVIGVVTVVFKPKTVLGDEEKCVIFSRDAEIFCGASGTFCAFNTSYKYPLGVIGGTCYNIEELVYSIAKVDIGYATLLI